MIFALQRLLSAIVIVLAFSLLFWRHLLPKAGICRWCGRSVGDGEFECVRCIADPYQHDL